MSTNDWTCDRCNDNGYGEDEPGVYATPPAVGAECALCGAGTSPAESARVRRHEEDAVRRLTLAALLVQGTPRHPSRSSVDEMESRPADPSSPATRLLRGHLLTVDDVAALASMTPGSVYKAAERGEIPGTTRVGRRLRFRVEGVRRFLGGRHVGVRDGR